MGAFVPFDAGMNITSGLSPVNTLVVQIMDDQNEGAAVIHGQVVDDTATHVFVVSGAKNGTGGADDMYTVSVQSVTNGVPSGILGGGSPASATFPNATYPIASWGTNTGFWIQLANSIALQAGTTYAFVVQRTGATDGTNFLRFNYGLSSTTVSPYTATCNSAGTWTKLSSAYPAFMGWKSATAVYGMPSETITSNAFGSTTETGFAFTLPSAFGASNTYALRQVTLYAAGTAPAAAGTMVASLYDGTLGSAAALQRTTTIDSDDFGANNTNRVYEFVFPEDTLSPLTPGTKYGVGFAHSGATSGSIRSIAIDSSADAAAYPWGGFPRLSRALTDYPPSGNDTTTFTETATEMVVAQLWLQEFTAAASGGGPVGQQVGMM